MSPETIAFEIRGIPVPQGSSRGFLVGGKVRITTANRGLAVWRRLVSDVAQHHAPNPLWEGPLAVTLMFRLPEPKHLPKRRRVWPDRRPDLDKLCRACLDSLTGIVWRDDSQVVRLDANKDYGAPGVMIWVEQVVPEAEPTVPVSTAPVIWPVSAPATPEGEIDAIDTLPVKRAERSVGKDYEPEDFF